MPHTRRHALTHSRTDKLLRSTCRNSAFYFIAIQFPCFNFVLIAFFASFFFFFVDSAACMLQSAQPCLESQFTVVVPLLKGPLYLALLFVLFCLIVVVFRGTYTCALPPCMRPVCRESACFTLVSVLVKPRVCFKHSLHVCNDI